jgi:tetratricopeptide (TPR) repeat protein
VINSLLIVGGCTQPPKQLSVNIDQSELSPEEKKYIAQDYFIEGKGFERRGELLLALQKFEDALRYDPESKKLRIEVAKKYVMTGQSDDALKLILKGKKNEAIDDDEKRLLSSIYIKNEEYEKAAEAISNLKNKSDEEIYSLGFLFESTGELEKSIKYYKIFYEKFDRPVQMGYKIGKMLVSLKRYAEAASLYDSLMLKAGESAGIYVLVGGLKIVQGDTVGGYNAFNKALSLDSVNEDALRNLAQMALVKNDIKKAIFYYEKLYTNTALGEVYGRTLSMLYYQNKQYDKSEKVIRALLKTSADDYELHYYLGLTSEALGKRDTATIQLEKSIAIRNTFEDSWRDLCILFIKDKNYEKALDIAKKYANTLPDVSGGWRMVAYVYTIKKDYQNAIEMLKKSTKIDSTDVYLWFEMGSAYERIKDIDNASICFKKVLKIRPDDATTLNYLGYMWAENGIKLDTASILLKKALNIEPGNGAFLDSYAWICYKKGNIDSAYHYILKALEKIKDDPVVYAHLGDILMEKNEYPKARDAYNKSIELKADDIDVLRKKIIEIEMLIKNGSSIE